MIVKELKALRTTYPQCQILALADISSGIVLCVSADEKPPQEKLDAYCTLATRMLASPAAVAATDDLGLGSPSVATANTAEQSVIFVRSKAEPGEALLCSASHDLDTDRFVMAAQSSLEKISNEQ